MGTITLTPVADTWISNANPTTNYGSQNDIYFGEVYGDSNLTRMLIKFDLSSLVQKKKITSAVLRLYDLGNDFTNNNRTVRVHRSMKPWTENGATWNKYDSTNNWTTAGSDNNSSDWDSGADFEIADLGTFIAPNPPITGYVDIGLDPDLIQELVDGVRPNYGFFITSDGENDDAHRHYSRSGLNPPQLIIGYSNTYSLRFNGVNQRARNSAALNIGEGPPYIGDAYEGATVEGWFKIHSLPGVVASLFGIGTRAASSVVNAALRVESNGKLDGLIGAGGADSILTATSALALETWFHGAVVYDGAYIYLYMGTEDEPDESVATPQAKTGDMNIPGTNHNGMYIGCYGVTSSSDFGDHADFSAEGQVRFWDHARTLAQINKYRKRKIQGDTPGLIGIFDIEEGGNGTLFDLSPNENHLVLDNRPTWSTDVPFSKYSIRSKGAAQIMGMLR